MARLGATNELKDCAVADYSADFEVEDYIPVPRLVDDNEATRVNSPGSTRWLRQPKSNASISSGGAAPKQPIADLDPHRLAQRQKQIDYGKNTIGYQRYLQQVPKNKRRRKGEQWMDPVTPDIHQNISKRCFDGQVKVWRRALHKYDLQPEEDEPPVRPIPFAERHRMALQGGHALNNATAVSAAPSSPTNSSVSRGSLDGYMEPATSGRKRCFQRAFDHTAGDNPHPSKLLTSPAGPRPVAPQSAPPATAGDTEVASTPAGRCADPPVMVGREGLSRGGAAAAAGLPKAPQTAPPTAVARVTVGATVDAPEDHDPIKSELGAAAVGDDLFREWEDDDYAGLEPFDDAELEGVGL